MRGRGGAVPFGNGNRGWSATPWMVALGVMGMPGVGAGATPCGPDGSPVRGTASFVLVQGDEVHEMSFGEENLVFCRATSPAMTWIRFAGSRENDGNDVPHLDIDVCHLASGPRFVPMEARAQPCPGGATWAVWWHGGDGAVYANRGDAAPCVLEVERAGTRLSGTFSCRGLVSDDGGSGVDLLEGRFECGSEGDPGASRFAGTLHE
jgi:hypothetical protein